MSHAWCRDIDRDEAVRAAEDGRTGPLPTLEEAIATITHKGDHMGTKSDEQAADYRRKASGLRTERVTLEFEIDRGVSPREWPWLYILSRSDAHKMRPSESVRVVEEFGTALPKVVEDMAAEITRLDSERDAAIRERDESDAKVAVLEDKLKQATDRLEVLDVKSDERDKLREKLNRCPECNGEGKHDSGGMDASGEWINLPCEGCGSTGTIHGYFEATDKLRASLDKLTEQATRDHATILQIAGERDEAIRKRDKLTFRVEYLEDNSKFWFRQSEAYEKRASVLAFRVAELEGERDGLKVDVSALMDVGHRLGSQVKSLESQLESVACRAATAETALESAPAARDLYDIGHKISPFMTLSSGPDGSILEMKFKSYADGAALHGAMVRFFKSAPAASGAAVCENAHGSSTEEREMSGEIRRVVPFSGGDPGSTPGHASRQPASGAAGTEAMAYFVKWDEKDWGVQDQTFRTLERAQDYIQDEKSEDENPQIVPLYAAPQAASGWLTKKDREWLTYLLENVPISFAADEWIHSLLARSSPPEVVLEDFTPDAVRNLDTKYLAGWDQCMALAKRAIIAAGVKVKEVG